MRFCGEEADYDMDMLDEPSQAPTIVAEPELTAERAFKDLETILYSVASSPSHYRNFAVHYMRCRGVLLRGEGRSAVPGFLVQCGTSEKFRDFITLYDASVGERHAFIGYGLTRCRALYGGTRSYDPFDDEDF
jgi:hypothetical protein